MSSNWETLNFEDAMKRALVRDLKQSEGDTRFGLYVTARKSLIDNILEEIRAVQPELTDHGPTHVRNVLQNIEDLLGDLIDEKDGTKVEGAVRPIDGMELYVLGLCALFHDVGNVFDRVEHQKQIGQIYDFVRPAANGNQYFEERRIVLAICKAHCGDCSDGSKNTLDFVEDRAKLDRREIRPKLLASILRFADELAEGEQRTSHFMLAQGCYTSVNSIYHNYAACSSVDIDRANGRICLKYHIQLDPAGGKGKLSPGELGGFLSFIYTRIEKLNQERQYAKHYCYLLDPFKETSASFTFWYRGREILIDLSPVILSDLVVPGDPRKSVVERNADYNEVELSNKITAEINRMGCDK